MGTYVPDERELLEIEEGEEDGKDLPNDVRLGTESQ